MKKLLIVLVLFLLCGCNNNDNISSLIDPFNELAKSEITYTNNMTKKYYSYYLNPNFGKISSDEISSELIYKNTTFLMNLKVNKIIVDNYYNQIEDENYQIGQLIFNNNGNYLQNGIEYSYNYKIYEITENSYYFVLDTEYLNFSTISNIADLKVISLEMLEIAKSVKVNEEELIADYSNKETIDYVKETIDLFEQKIPESGTLEEMMGLNENGEEDIDKSGREEEPENSDISETDEINLEGEE